MKTPNQLSRRTIKELGCSDSHAVRVILHSVSNEGQARLNCGSRQYVFEKHPVTLAHTLDFPISVWMHGASAGRYRHQRAICDDFHDLIKSAAYTIHLVSYGEQSEAATAPQAAPTLPPQTGNALPEVRRLLSNLGAPGPVVQLFALIETGSTAEQLTAFVDGVLSTPETATPEETPAQKQARKMREAKEAKKKAQLQTD